MSKILVTFYGGPLDGGTEAVEISRVGISHFSPTARRTHLYEYDKDSFLKDEHGQIHAKAIYAGVKE